MAPKNDITLTFGADENGITKLRKSIEKKLTKLDVNISAKSSADIAKKIKENTKPKIDVDLNLSSARSLSTKIRRAIGKVPVEVDIKVTGKSLQDQLVRKGVGTKKNFDRLREAGKIKLSITDRGLVTEVGKALRKAQLLLDQKNLKVKLRIDTGRTGSDLSKQNKEIQTVTNNVKKLKRSHDDSAGSALSFSNAHRKASNELDNFSQRIGFTTTRLSAYLIPATAIFRLSQGFRFAATSIVDLNREITKLTQILGGNVKEAEDVVRRTLNIAQDFGASGRELVEVARILSQAGEQFRGSDNLLSAIESLAKSQLGPTFDDIKSTTSGVIAALNQFNLAGTETARILDVTNELAKQFSFESSNFFTAVERGGAAFAASGGTVEEFAALVATLRSLTRLPSSTIGTSINTISLRLLRQEELGILDSLTDGRIRDAAGNLKPITEVLLEASKAAKELSAEELGQIVDKLSGVRQGKALIPLLENPDRFADTLKTVGSSFGSVERDARIGLERIDVILQRVGARFDEVFAGLAQNRGVTRLVQDFASLAGVIADITGLIGPLLPTLTRFAAVRAIASSYKFSKDFVRGAREINPGGFKGTSEGIMRGLSPHRKSVDSNTVALNRLASTISGTNRTSTAGAGFSRRAGRTVINPLGAEKLTNAPVTDIGTGSLNSVQNTSTRAARRFAKMATLEQQLLDTVGSRLETERKIKQTSRSLSSLDLKQQAIKKDILSNLRLQKILGNDRTALRARQRDILSRGVDQRFFSQSVGGITAGGLVDKNGSFLSDRESKREIIRASRQQAEAELNLSSRQNAALQRSVVRSQERLVEARRYLLKIEQQKIRDSKVLQEAHKELAIAEKRAAAAINKEAALRNANIKRLADRNTRRSSFLGRAGRFGRNTLGGPGGFALGLGTLFGLDLLANRASNKASNSLNGITSDLETKEVIRLLKDQQKNRKKSDILSGVSTGASLGLGLGFSFGPLGVLAGLIVGSIGGALVGQFSSQSSRLDRRSVLTQAIGPIAAGEDLSQSINKFAEIAFASQNKTGGILDTEQLLEDLGGSNTTRTRKILEDRISRRFNNSEEFGAGRNSRDSDLDFGARLVESFKSELRNDLSNAGLEGNEVNNAFQAIDALINNTDSLSRIGKNATEIRESLRLIGTAVETLASIAVRSARQTQNLSVLGQGISTRSSLNSSRFSAISNAEQFSLSKTGTILAASFQKELGQLRGGDNTINRSTVSEAFLRRFGSFFNETEASGLIDASIIREQVRAAAIEFQNTLPSVQDSSFTQRGGADIEAFFGQRLEAIRPSLTAAGQETLNDIIEDISARIGQGDVKAQRQFLGNPASLLALSDARTTGNPLQQQASRVDETINLFNASLKDGLSILEQQNNILEEQLRIESSRISVNRGILQRASSIFGQSRGLSGRLQGQNEQGLNLGGVQSSLTNASLNLAQARSAFTAISDIGANPESFAQLQDATLSLREAQIQFNSELERSNIAVQLLNERFSELARTTRQQINEASSTALSPIGERLQGQLSASNITRLIGPLFRQGGALQGVNSLSDLTPDEFGRLSQELRRFANNPVFVQSSQNIGSFGGRTISGTDTTLREGISIVSAAAGSGIGVPGTEDNAERLIVNLQSLADTESQIVKLQSTQIEAQRQLANELSRVSDSGLSISGLNEGLLGVQNELVTTGNKIVSQINTQTNTLSQLLEKISSGGGRETTINTNADIRIEGFDDVGKSEATKALMVGFIDTLSNQMDPSDPGQAELKSKLDTARNIISGDNVNGG